MQRRITDFAADGSFAVVNQKMKEHYGVEVPESSARAIALNHACSMKKQADASLEQEPGPAGESRQLIGEMDGSFVPIVRFDENAEGDKRKTRKTDWQEVKLCLAYEQGRQGKRYEVTLGDVDEAGKRWLSCAIKQGLNQQSKIHCVSDGARWIESQAKRVFGEQSSFLVDYYHLSEYLANGAKDCVGSDEVQQKRWTVQQQERMKRGDIETVLAELEPFRNKQLGKKANPAEACHRYIRNREGQFDYRAAEAANLPIGSGEIESSNRAVVQKRLKVPGAWWLPSNVAVMLELLAMRANSEWEDYWKNTG